ncbi:MAG: transglycosylase domain-containing protein [Vicinamibacteria bacterium]
MTLIGQTPPAVGDRARAVAARAIEACRRVGAWMHRAAPRQRVLRIAAAVIALPVMGAALLMHHIKYDRSDVPAIEPLVRFEPPTIGHLYDARGELILELAREYRWVVRYPEIPVTLREAVLAAEDKNYFSHTGVDFGALPRVAGKAALRTFAASRRVSREDGKLRVKVVFPQGGSTLTQQLVRGYFLADVTKDEDANVLQRPTWIARSMASVLGVPATNKLRRKVEEMRLSLWLEEEFQKRYGSQQAAKEEILARYASFIYLGNGRYGFSAASEYYFDKPLSEYQQWDADKAALLAGIAKSPRDYAPTPANLDRPLRRRNDVLALMAKREFISDELADQCRRQPITLARVNTVKTEAPAAVKNAMAELARNTNGKLTLGQFADGNIRVHSTIDNRIQAAVNAALERGLADYEQRHPAARGMIQGSVVVLSNQDARVLAEAGGRATYRNRRTSYTDFNRAVESFRQPGSALKPIVYLTAFARGLRLDNDVYDEPISVPMGAGRPAKWIGNYDGEFKGVIPMRLALAESRNCATMWITEQVGLRQVLQTARELGIHSTLQPYPTTVLGASEVNLLELANMYRALASGISAEPHIVERATDRSGQEVYRARATSRPMMLPAGTLEAMQEGLRGVVRLPSGTAHALDNASFPIPVMGKTGTTSNFRDALFVGSTYGPRGITIAVRVGFDDNRELGAKETGGRTALPIFRDVMLRVYRDNILGPAPQFPRFMEAGIDRYLEGPRQLDAARLAEASVVEAPETEAVARPALFAAPTSAHEPAVALPAVAVDAAPAVASSATFYAPAPNHRDQR